MSRLKKDSNLTVEVLKVLRSERLDEKNRIDLRIVRWGRANRPVLEKRRIWERQDGERAMKCIGLNGDDLQFVYDNYAEIINML